MQGSLNRIWAYLSSSRAQCTAWKPPSASPVLLERHTNLHKHLRFGAKECRRRNDEVALMMLGVEACLKDRNAHTENAHTQN